jgi:putative peptidoglycan lipid II flippase
MPRSTSPSTSRRPRRLAASAAIYAAATGLSRVIGLLREIIFARLLGAGVAANAFTVASVIPNTVRSLVADAALGASFIPVFNELLERGEDRRAWRVASTAITVATVGLSAITALGILLAGPIVDLLPLKPESADLTVNLVRILFPVVLLLGLTGLVNSILMSFGEFTVPALAPVAWNLVIIAFLLVGFSSDDPDFQVQLYAWGWLAGTLVQFLLPLPWLRGRGGRLTIAWDVGDPALRRIFTQMVPITLGLGLINVNLLIATMFAAAIDGGQYAARAIEASFRIYMLPQGMFSVAVAAVLFPTMSRLAAAGDIAGFRHTVASGTRQIAFLLLPAAAFLAVLAEPIVRLLYQHGAWTAADTTGSAQALAAFCLGLAANGVLLLLNRAFFSLQLVWLPTWIAAGNLLLNTALLWVLYDTAGVWGIPLATSIANLVTAVVQWRLLRDRVGDLELRETLESLALVLAACALLAAVSWATWTALDAALGRSLLAQVASVGLALAFGAAAYIAAAALLRVPEVAVALSLVRRRIQRPASRL